MFKKIFIILYMLALTGMIASGQSRTVMVDTKGNLKYPAADVFANQNNLATQNNLSLLIDCSYNILLKGKPTDEYVSEIEVKVLDKENNLLYHYSTVQGHQNHGDDIEDTNAVIAVTYSGADINYLEGGCAKPKIILSNVNGLRVTLSDADKFPAFRNESIITSVQVFPSAKFIEKFLNSENTVLILRWCASAPDMDNHGNKAWKQAPILYIPKPSTSN